MEKNAIDNSNYRSYLLRLWGSQSQGKIKWHVLLVEPRTGERHGFENLNLTMEFLESELANALQGQAEEP